MSSASARFGDRTIALSLAPDGTVGERRSFLSTDAARHELAAWAGDPIALQSLRWLLSEAAVMSPAEQLEVDSLLTAVAEQVACGRIAWCERRDGPAPAGRYRPPASPPAEAAPVEATRETHWIEVELIGEDGQPVAGERFELRLPGGRVRYGRTGANGVGRVDGFEDGGACTLTFPDLDTDAWEGA